MPFEVLYAAADSTLYQVKEAGKAQYQLTVEFSVTMRSAASLSPDFYDLVKKRDDISSTERGKWQRSRSHWSKNRRSTIDCRNKRSGS